MSNTVDIRGHCDPRFSVVEEAFAKNFESGEEVGASFAATIDGEFVVDIWGGYADAAQTRPWERDTIVNVYSTTKPMTALCAHILVDRGLLDLDAPVSQYWPEFAQAGKQNLPVRYLLSHQSGLSGWEESFPVETLYDWDQCIKLLAAQKPWWEPGTASGYHAHTFGYLVGEVVRRITNKTVGTFFREEVAVPLEADFHIGLSEEHDPRVGELIPPPELAPEGFEIDPNSVFAKTFRPPTPPELTRDRAWRAAEIPASNGHGNAHSIARIAALLACGGELEGVRLLTLPTIENSVEEQCYGPDLVLGIPFRWGLGWGLSSKEAPLPNPRCFTWGGYGGSILFVDLDARLSWAYAMNKMVASLTGDPRSAGLGAALYSAL
jgi:CubicO group peptidase (beta-lactamase class C family)